MFGRIGSDKWVTFRAHKNNHFGVNVLRLEILNGVYVIFRGYWGEMVKELVVNFGI
jgi:hypothetical protein